MKILLILWAIGLAACDKLDRTYLPPRGSNLAGGYPQDLNLPLEFPKENLSPTLIPGINRTSDNLSTSNYPNVALGIDRESPFVTSSPKFTNRPEIFVSKNTYNIPTTTTSYDLTETSTFLPVEVFDTTVGPVTTVPQRYSSTSSSFNPNQSYDQYVIQENIKANNVPQKNPNYISRGSLSNLPIKNIGVQTGGSVIQAENNQDKPSIGYGGDLDSISKISIPSTKTSYFDENLNEQTFNPIQTGRFPTLTPAKTFVENLVTNVAPSSKYSSSPTSSNNFDTRYNTKFQPQRVQAEDDRIAVILNYENILTPEGFAYSFDTSNGIHADESGTANNGVKAKGSYSFTGDDGKIYTVEYTADENGFLPRGDHLPTAPPIPNAILKVIEQAEMDTILGIVEDGSYDNAKYGHLKYQGLMDRIPQNQYDNIIVSQPNFKEGGKTTTFGNKLPAYNKNNGVTLHQLSSSSEPDGSSQSPDRSKIVEAYKKDTNVDEDDKDYPSFYRINRPDGNRFINSEAEHFNSEPNFERNKFKGNTITSTPRLNEELNSNTEKKYTVSPKENSAQNSGYVYTLPENMLSDKDQNNLHLNFPSIRRNYENNPDDETRNDRITGDEFTNPRASLNFQKQKPVTSSPILRKTFNNYVTVSDVAKNDNTKPDIPTSYNRELGQIKNGQIIVPERVYPSTLEPKFVSTTKKPYNYQSPYTFNENSKQSTYPSSTFGSQYSVSTTPVPSEFSSPTTNIFSSSSPSTSNVRYSVTTPTTSQYTSTLRPSITSRRPTSNITSRPSAYTGRISEPEDVQDSRISTTRPNTFGQRILGRPGYNAKPNKIPTNQEGLSDDIEPEFVELKDPRSQNLKVTSRPGNFNTQSTSRKVIGEDFNGPKQAQRFDPEYGYYY